jgi:DNA-binding winged helix-turn-helix (wHTH) protein
MTNITYRFLDFELDVRNACLRRAGTPVPLRPKSFDVLLHLVRNPGRLVTKDELIEAVWAPVVVTENSLVQCIREAREAIGDADQARIETVAKRGYIFTPKLLAETPRTMPRRKVAAIAVVAILAVAGGAWLALAAGAFRDAAAPQAQARRFPVAVLPFDAPAGPSTESY